MSYDVQSQSPRSTIDTRAENLLTRLIRVGQERVRRQFFRECRNIEQNRFGILEPRKRWERADETRFLGAAFVWGQRHDRRADRVAPAFFGLRFRQNKPPPQCRWGAFENPQFKWAPKPRVVLENSSKETMSVPYGFNVGSPKGSPRVEHGRGFAWVNQTRSL
jgi:hypothetical protein